MKKLFTIMVLLCAITLPFTGCYHSLESEWESDVSYGVSGSLAGTKWSCDVPGSASKSLLFKDNGKVTYSDGSDSLQGSYSLDGMNIIIMIEKEDESKGIMSDNVISFAAASSGPLKGLSFTKN